MRLIAVFVMLALSGCTTVAKVKVATQAVEKAVDIKTALEYKNLCYRLSYRAEMKLRSDYKISKSEWDAFCKRLSNPEPGR